MGAQTVRISLLGALRIQSNGADLAFTAPPRTLPLLAYLAIHRARPSARDAVAFTLWPDVSEDAARANLRRHLHYLNRALPPRALPPRASPWVDATNRTVRWHPEACAALDLVEFERLSSSAATRARAVRLYAGDLLESVDEEWLLYERDRLRNVQLANLEALASEAAARNEPAAVVDFALAVLALDPYREDAARALMLARRALGDRAGAVADYRRLEARLRDELGVAPMAETRATYDAVASSGTRPAAVRAPSAFDPSHLPFVGRSAHVAHVQAAWSHARQGRGRLILIGGEAGIGKSRLAGEIAQAVARGGDRSTIGRTSYGEPSPYQALVEALPRAPFDGIARLPSIDLDADRDRLAAAFFAAFMGLAGGAPLLVILEDLHWSGAATLAVIERLATLAAGAPLLLVATYREEEVDRTHPLRLLRRRTTNDGAATHLALSPLDFEAVDALVADVFALSEKRDELTDFLLVQSEGNPLFVRELVRDAIESKGVVREDGRWRIASLAVPKVPRGIRSTILDRLSRLPDEAYSLAESAAVLGRGFDLELLAGLTGWSEARVVTALDVLLDRQIVADVGSRGSGRFVFSHQLVAATMYEAASDGDLRARHRRAALVLEQVFAERVGERAGDIAGHYDRAGDACRASTWYGTAARAALAVGATDAVTQFVSRALAGAPNDHRFSLLALREEAAARETDRATQRRDLDEMLVLAQTPDDPERLAIVHRRRLEYAQQLADAALVDAELGAFEAAATRTRDARMKAELDLVLGPLFFNRGDHARAAEALGRARAFFEREGPLERVGLCLTRLAHVHAARGDFAATERTLARAYDVVADDDHLALLRLAIVEANLGDWLDDAQRQHRAGRAQARHAHVLGDRAREASGHAIQALAATLLLLPEEALEHVTRAESLARETDRVDALGHVLTARAAVERLAGNREGAIETCRRAVDEMRRRGFALGETLAATNLAQALLEAGERREAKRFARTAATAARRHGLALPLARALDLCAAVELERGRAREALPLLRRSNEILRASGTRGTLAAHLALLVRTLAMQQAFVEAEALADEMLALCRRLPSPNDATHACSWAAAGAARAAGQHERSNALLQQAHALLSQRASALKLAPRTAYLSLPVHREMCAAFECGDWPTWVRPSVPVRTLVPS